MITKLRNYDAQNCSYYTDRYDYDNDGHMNYRELTVIGHNAMYDKLKDTNRGPQLNCSECWGSTYNIGH